MSKNRDRRPPMSDDGDAARFEREREAQQRRRRELEQTAVGAFAEWLGEIVKQYVTRAVRSFWDWLKGLFR